MNRDELKNALSGVKSLTISVDDYIYFQELKKSDTAKGLSFDEHEGDPFFHGCKDVILQYREVILALTRVGNPNLYHNYKTMSDEEFFEEINK